MTQTPKAVKMIFACNSGGSKPVYRSKVIRQCRVGAGSNRAAADSRSGGWLSV